MGEDDVICDFAQYYGILDFRRVPPVLVGTLFLGLPDNSRIKMKLAGQKITIEQTLLAIIADNLSFLAWCQTKDAQHGYNRPASILDALRNAGKPKEDEVQGFDSGEEFDLAFKKLTGGD